MTSEQSSIQTARGVGLWSLSEETRTWLAHSCKSQVWITSNLVGQTCVDNAQPPGICWFLASPFARKSNFGMVFFPAAEKSVFFLEVLWQFSSLGQPP